MNLESLASWLDAIGVPHEVISIGKEADNTWCVLRTEQVQPAAQPGDPQPAEQTVVTWEVFWREHGIRYDWARFTNEQVACHYLFGRLAWSQVARGAVGLLPERDPGRSPVDQS